MMRTNRKGVIFALLALGLAGRAAPALSAPVPPSLTNLLTQREQSLSLLTTVWAIKSHDDIAPQLRGGERKLPESERSPAVIDSGAVWRIVRSGSAALVSGKPENAPPSVHPPTYDQFYQGGVEMLVYPAADSTVTLPTGKVVPIKDKSWVQVWPTPGDSRLCPAPLVNLNVQPEHFITLAGVNPLGMYGVRWTLLSQTPQTWTLEGAIAASNFTDEERLIVTLSRVYGGAPLKISRRSLQSPAVSEWEVTDYQQHKGAWIGHKIIYHQHAPGIVERVVKYTLQSAEASHPIMLPVRLGAQVVDYRLLGDRLTREDLMQAQSRRHGIVYYQWLGQLLDLDDLKETYQDQHPGEATPDPRQSRSNPLGKGPLPLQSPSSPIGANLPFAGGLLCLVGGVWMFKRRGKS